MTENTLSARENDIAMATIELNKKSHILEDRLVALELLVHRIKQQAIERQKVVVSISEVSVTNFE